MAVSRHMGGFGEDVANGLVLKHDNGSNYISEEFQSEIALFGIERPRIPPASASGKRRGGAVHPDT